MKKLPRGKPFPKGNDTSKDNPGNPGAAVVEQHVQLVFQRMATGHEGMVALWSWCHAQGWSHSHTATVLRQARHLLKGVTQEKAEDTRARLMAFIEFELSHHCTDYVTGTGEGPNAGTVIMKDPTSKEFADFRRLSRRRRDWQVYEWECKTATLKGKDAPAPPSTPWTAEDEERLEVMAEQLPSLTKRNHAAIQGYLKLAMRITGIDTLVVEHRPGARPYRDMPTAELMEEIARLESAEADALLTAEIITVKNEEETNG